MVSAVFYCNFKEGTTVKFNPVVDPDGKYKSYSKYTPSGSCELQITNPAAMEQFERGKLYKVTFEAE